MFQKMIRFFRDAYAELRRVTWPSRKEIMGSTLVVFIVVTILMVFIALFDLFLSFVVKLLV